jgi:hypothetical protein
MAKSLVSAVSKDFSISRSVKSLARNTMHHFMINRIRDSQQNLALRKPPRNPFSANASIEKWSFQLNSAPQPHASTVATIKE